MLQDSTTSGLTPLTDPAAVQALNAAAAPPPAEPVGTWDPMALNAAWANIEIVAFSMIYAVSTKHPAIHEWAGDRLTALQGSQADSYYLEMAGQVLQGNNESVSNQTLAMLQDLYATSIGYGKDALQLPEDDGTALFCVSVLFAVRTFYEILADIGHIKSPGIIPVLPNYGKEYFTFSTLASGEGAAVYSAQAYNYLATQFPQDIINALISNHIPQIESNFNYWANQDPALTVFWNNLDNPYQDGWPSSQEANDNANDLWESYLDLTFAVEDADQAVIDANASVASIEADIKEAEKNEWDTTKLNADLESAKTQAGIAAQKDQETKTARENYQKDPSPENEQALMDASQAAVDAAASAQSYADDSDAMLVVLDIQANAAECQESYDAINAIYVQAQKDNQQGLITDAELANYKQQNDDAYDNLQLALADEQQAEDIADSGTASAQLDTLNALDEDTAELNQFLESELQIMMVSYSLGESAFLWKSTPFYYSIVGADGKTTYHQATIEYLYEHPDDNYRIFASTNYAGYIAPNMNSPAFYYYTGKDLAVTPLYDKDGNRLTYGDCYNNLDTPVYYENGAPFVMNGTVTGQTVLMTYNYTGYGTGFCNQNNDPPGTGQDLLEFAIIQEIEAALPTNQAVDDANQSVKDIQDQITLAEQEGLNTDDLEADLKAAQAEATTAQQQAAAAEAAKEAYLKDPTSENLQAFIDASQASVDAAASAQEYSEDAAVTRVTLDIQANVADCQTSYDNMEKIYQQAVVSNEKGLLTDEELADFAEQLDTANDNLQLALQDQSEALAIAKSDTAYEQLDTSGGLNDLDEEVTQLNQLMASELQTMQIQFSEETQNTLQTEIEAVALMALLGLLWKQPDFEGSSLQTWTYYQLTLLSKNDTLTGTDVDGWLDQALAIDDASDYNTFMTGTVLPQFETDLKAAKKEETFLQEIAAPTGDDGFYMFSIGVLAIAYGGAYSGFNLKIAESFEGSVGASGVAMYAYMSREMVYYLSTQTVSSGGMLTADDLQMIQDALNYNPTSPAMYCFFWGSWSDPNHPTTYSEGSTSPSPDGFNAGMDRLIANEEQGVNSTPEMTSRNYIVDDTHLAFYEFVDDTTHESVVEQPGYKPTHEPLSSAPSAPPAPANISHTASYSTLFEISETSPPPENKEQAKDKGYEDFYYYQYQLWLSQLDQNDTLLSTKA